MAGTDPPRPSMSVRGRRTRVPYIPYERRCRERGGVCPSSRGFDSRLSLIAALGPFRLLRFGSCTSIGAFGGRSDGASIRTLNSNASPSAKLQVSLLSSSKEIDSISCRTSAGAHPTISEAASGRATGATRAQRWRDPECGGALEASWYLACPRHRNYLAVSSELSLWAQRSGEAPGQGEHTQEVLGDIGCSAPEGSELMWVGAVVG